jgi:hypothetical protein
MIVNRRGFLGMTIGGVVAGAAVRTWPFRVFSFPLAPIIPSNQIDVIDLKFWGRQFHMSEEGVIGRGTGTAYEVKIINGVRTPVIVNYWRFSQFESYKSGGYNIKL